MIRTAIAERINELKISKRKCALDNGLNYQNFNNFILGKRPLPLDDIEKVLAYLNLELKASKKGHP